MVIDIVERLRTEAPCYVLIGDAAIEIERLREQCDRMASLAIDNAKDTDRALAYAAALRTIGYGPPNEGEPLDLLNQFVDLARKTLEENKK